ncbi:MAG: hypothetical protein H6581_27640 [Bacteroidia bacterium]|nr:hypothetical protein [Bacteroidia bacterium]
MKRITLIATIFALFGGLILFESCKKDPIQDDDNNPPQDTTQNSGPPAGTRVIQPSTQRSGDADAGYEYLTTGDYVASGIPYSLYKTVFGDDNSNLLNRTGDNATIPINYTAVNAPNGVRVVVPNCMQCHAQTLNGQLVMGLGNTTFDFTADQSSVVPGVDLAINLFYGPNSAEWDAYEPFRKSVLATGPHLITDVVGANPADKIAMLLASYRDKDDLTWQDNQHTPVPAQVIPTDVPAWWLLKKKHAMFYAGVGRGDFSRIMMASGILTLSDTTEARVTDTRFADVYAYLLSLEAPPYPQTVDADLASKGEEVFTIYCSKCHGTYNKQNELYPNLLVELDKVETDPVLSEVYQEQVDFVNWYNSSWFGQGVHGARMESEGGYVAPPLDGIWATAPYLHNGSVPTLEDLLKSSQRPTFWRRSFDTGDLDYQKVGWNYAQYGSKQDNQTYDATKPGYGNQGHTFGDVLSDAQRTALIEYLKTI